MSSLGLTPQTVSLSLSDFHFALCRLEIVCNIACGPHRECRSRGDRRLAAFSQRPRIDLGTLVALQLIVPGSYDVLVAFWLALTAIYDGSRLDSPQVHLTTAVGRRAPRCRWFRFEFPLLPSAVCQCEFLGLLVRMATTSWCLYTLLFAQNTKKSLKTANLTFPL